MSQAMRLDVARAAPLTAEGFQRFTGVSRETLERLTRYVAFLDRWNRAINLVSADSLNDVWRRHLLDSAQLIGHMPELEAAGPRGHRRTRVVLDLGSGGGFPGMVLAMLGVGEVHLVESDQRKAVFLREVARETDTEISLHPQRIETLSPFAVDIVTARGLAPLSRLMAYAAPFLTRRGPGHAPCALFLKGRSGDEELTESKELWDMEIETFASISDVHGKILRVHLQPIGIPRQ